MIVACACTAPGLIPSPKQPLRASAYIFFSRNFNISGLQNTNVFFARRRAPRVYGSSSNADDGVVMRAYLCACQVEQLQLCIYLPSIWATFVPLRLALLAARSTTMSMLKDPTWTHAILYLCGLAQVLFRGFFRVVSFVRRGRRLRRGWRM